VGVKFISRDVVSDILPYQVVGRLRAYQADDGYGGLVSDSGEGARVKATTSKDGSRRATCPLLIGVRQ